MASNCPVLKPETFISFAEIFLNISALVKFSLTVFTSRYYDVSVPKILRNQ